MVGVGADVLTAGSDVVLVGPTVVTGAHESMAATATVFTVNAGDIKLAKLGCTAVPDFCMILFVRLANAAMSQGSHETLPGENVNFSVNISFDVFE